MGRHIRADVNIGQNEDIFQCGGNATEFRFSESFLPERENCNGDTAPPSQPSPPNPWLRQLGKVESCYSLVIPSKFHISTRVFTQAKCHSRILLPTTDPTTVATTDSSIYPRSHAGRKIKHQQINFSLQKTNRMQNVVVQINIYQKLNPSNWHCRTN